MRVFTPHRTARLSLLTVLSNSEVVGLACVSSLKVVRCPAGKSRPQRQSGGFKQSTGTLAAAGSEFTTNPSCPVTRVVSRCGPRSSYWCSVKVFGRVLGQCPRSKFLAVRSVVCAFAVDGEFRDSSGEELRLVKGGFGCPFVLPGGVARRTINADHGPRSKASAMTPTKSGKSGHC